MAGEKYRSQDSRTALAMPTVSVGTEVGRWVRLHAPEVYSVCGAGGGGSGVGCCLKTTTPSGGRVTESV